MRISIRGDRELWLVKRKDWCLPIYVTPCTTDENETVYCLITPALLKEAAQHDELTRVFDSPSICSDKDKWLVPVAFISNLAERAPGITPSFYYVWPEKESTNGEPHAEESNDNPSFDVPLKESAEKPSAESEEFLRFIFQEQPSMNIDHLRAVWHTLQIYGAEWIYKRQRTLDLGFVKLDALPYRQNWKQIFLARFPMIAKWCNIGRKQRNAKFEMDDEISRFIRGSWMVEIDPKDWFVYWTIEARQTEAWRKYVAENEQTRHRHYSNYGYSAWWRSKINKFETKIYDIFSEFVSATSKPCAGLSPRSSQGRRYLVPSVPMGRVLAQGEKHSRTFVVSPDPTQEMDDKGELGEIEFPTEPLPPMPGLQLQIEDVRNTGRMVDESKNERG